MEALTVVTLGSSRRQQDALRTALSDVTYTRFTLTEALLLDLSGRRILIALALDAWGMEESFQRLLLHARKNPNAFQNCVCALTVDCPSPLYARDCARTLAYALSGAGALLVGPCFAQASGAPQSGSAAGGSDAAEAFAYETRALCMRIAYYEKTPLGRPELLVLHASERASDEMRLCAKLARRLYDDCSVFELSIAEESTGRCADCPYPSCARRAEGRLCALGGAVSPKVLAAVSRADALLLLCPPRGYAPGARFAALFALLQTPPFAGAFTGKRAFCLLPSASDGELTAYAFLDALCMGNDFVLPPRFALTTAYGEGAEESLDAFAKNIRSALL